MSAAGSSAAVVADSRVHRVAFDVGGDSVIGLLHLPAGDGPHPAAVVGGPMTSVKEQVVGVYAAALAGRGIAALALDHRHYGESGGSPRQYEHAERKIEDLCAAVAWLTLDARIDAARIGALGVCLGAGYIVHAAVRTPRIRAVAAIAGYYRDPAEMRSRDPEDFDARIAQGVAARLHLARTGETLCIPAVALEGDAAMRSADTFDYYGRRAAVDNYRNAFALMSREHFLPFDVQAAAPLLRVPLLMVHSHNALSPQWAQRFHDATAAPRRLVWIDSRGQTDLYDDPARVAEAADLAAAHLHAAFAQPA